MGLETSAVDLSGSEITEMALRADPVIHFQKTEPSWN